MQASGNSRIRTTVILGLVGLAPQPEDPFFHHVMMKQPCVYMLASGYRRSIYIGVTSDLPKREWEHHIGLHDGHTKTYKIKRLVWFQRYDTMSEAIRNEKRFKSWYRDWKIELIEKTNPHWHRLNPDTGEFIYDE